MNTYSYTTYCNVYIYEWFKIMAWQDGQGYSGLDVQIISGGQNMTNLQLISLHLKLTQGSEKEKKTHVDETLVFFPWASRWLPFRISSSWSLIPHSLPPGARGSCKSWGGLQLQDSVHLCPVNHWDYCRSQSCCGQMFESANLEYVPSPFWNKLVSSGARRKKVLSSMSGCLLSCIWFISSWETNYSQTLLLTTMYCSPHKSTIWEDSGKEPVSDPHSILWVLPTGGWKMHFQDSIETGLESWYWLFTGHSVRAQGRGLCSSPCGLEFL